MAYIITILITLLLTFFEISFSHYFLLFGATAFFTLAFIAAFTIKSNSYIQIFVAFLAGSIFDFASVGHFGEFTIIFLLTIIMGRVLFYRKTSYGSINSYLTLLLISTFLIYLWQLPLLISNKMLGWQSFLRIVLVGSLMTVVFGIIIYKVTDGYFNWLQKKTEKY